MDCDKQLDEWSERYNCIRSKMVWKGYSSHIGHGYLGICSHPAPCNIRICHYFEGHNYWTYVTLWHEYCHAEASQKYNDISHGWNFIKCAIRKPLTFVMAVPAAFAYIILAIIHWPN